ncbi:MAG: hypothetical protein IJF39_05455 [Clostridia bacterium]|nr:hypothetical protein [Clostridia bacterium]
MSKNAGRSLRTIARQAKQRMKENFWESYRIEQQAKMELARQNGVNTQEAERFFAMEVERKIRGEEEVDTFYERVKTLLLSEGEVSDAIGRLTDYDLYETLSYTEKQRYTLALSEKYLRALERFKREYAFFYAKNNCG